MLLCIVLGAVIVLAGQWTLHKTSSTEFCLSCHTMQAPYEEYTGSAPFQNQNGIRAESPDCHIPEGGMGYLLAQPPASKDVYYQVITCLIYPSHAPGERSKQHHSGSCVDRTLE